MGLGLPAAVAAEPGAAACVVEIGPAVVPEVSDVLVLRSPAVATAVVSVVLLLAAEAELAPPLQPIEAAAARMNETRTERYIFPNCC